MDGRQAFPDRVFAMEAERGVEIRERLMEYELDGEFAFTGEDGASRRVRLRANGWAVVQRR